MNQTPNIQLWDIDRVRPYELNAKIHDRDQIKRIVESIKEFGWDVPIVVDRDGVIIKGHGRRLAAIDMGMQKVPVIVRDDLTPEQVRAARLADNRVALSGLDSDILKRELESLDFDLEGIFDKKELSFISADLATLDESAFVDDLDIAVRDQNEQTKKTIEEVHEKEVPIAKALGFKSVRIKDQRHINVMMAMIEAQTGLSGADAFVQFAREMQVSNG
jgi:ParB/RepB/Spo0J family partition protein